MDAQSLKQILRDTNKTLISYLTYQAVRTVYAQLDETDPKRAYRFHQFSSRESIRDGEAYLRSLFQEDRELAFRLLTVRAAIAEELADLIPEALRSGIQQANIEHRKEQLERMTQVANPAATDVEHLESGAETVEPGLTDCELTDREFVDPGLADHPDQAASDDT